MHPDLKKLLTILIIILLAGHTIGYFHALADSITHTQAAEDRGQTGIEEIKEKECINTCGLSFPERPGNLCFNLYPGHPDLLHVKDLITPPPDQATTA